ncbi:MAG: cation:proton antiporter [Anaerolineae bacterium]|nr:cation:proton antiporter [Anaerolineae bacterium]
MSELTLGMGLIAVVLLVSALVSGLVERAPLSFPMIFLALGFLLGGKGLGVLHIDAHNPLLEIVATVSLALVLFLDAVNVQLDELRREWYVPVLTLGPGTLLVILGIAVAAFALVGTTPVQSLLLGAILASTDPVVLRDILRDERIPRSVRRALGIEAGMNDLVVLPIVLVLIAVLTAEVANDAGSWIAFLLRILVASPLVGLAVGGIGAYLMGKADQRFNIRKEYQALYGIGLVLAAFVAGSAIQGDGFLAAFFAGLAVTIFNVSLCSCFMEYGEVTSEMLMLLAFVLFGALLSDLLGTINLFTPLLLAVITIVVIRPAVFTFVLKKANLSNAARLFIGWFGPRGLNSLLLALLAVQAAAPDAERLLAITGAVVVVSVILHGASATPVSAVYARRVAVAQITLVEEREGTYTGLFENAPTDTTFISPADLAALLQSGQPITILDVRARAHYDTEDGKISGSVRVLPDLIGDWMESQPKDQPIVVYCSCPNDATSIRVARQLKEQGFTARALQGGFHAWRDKYPVEPKNVIGVASILNARA